MLKFDWAVVQDERVVASVREHLNQVLTEKTGGKFSLTALHFGVQVPRRGGTAVWRVRPACLPLSCASQPPEITILELKELGPDRLNTRCAWLWQWWQFRANHPHRFAAA